MNYFIAAVLDRQGLIQTITAIVMIRIVFARKKPRHLLFLTGLLCTAGMMLANGCFNYLGQVGHLPVWLGFFLYYLLLVFFVCVYGHFSLDVSLRQLSATVLFQVGNLLLIYMLAGSVLAETSLTGTFRNLVNYGSASVILLLLALLYRRITTPVTVQLQLQYWLLVDFTQILSVILVAASARANNITGAESGAGRQGPSGSGLFGLPDHTMTAVLIDIVMIILDLTIYLLVTQLCGEMALQLHTQAINQNLRFQVRQIDNAQAMLENVRKVRHELKNNYFYLETLIREGKYDAALDHLHEVVAPSFAREEVVSTGNHLVDMILSQKLSEARQQKIPVSLEVHLPAELNINPEMLCSLLFNLLDNAIEASKKVSQPQINFVMQQVRGYLEIQVSNRIEGSVLKDNPQLHTSKKDSANHGIGMSMIREVVRQYNGDMHIEEKDGRFVVNIMLANAAKPAEDPSG